MRLRPCIDIHDGKVKQIVGSTLKDEGGQPCQNFVAEHDADWYANIYKDKKLPGGHVILLNSTKDAEMYENDRKQAFKAFSAYPFGMQAGGGITPGTAEAFLDAGASHVIVTSYVFRNGGLDEKRIEEMKSAVGAERLVLDLSCRRIQTKGNDTYAVVTDRWQKLTDLYINEDNLNYLSGYCDEFLIHAADVEGKRGGVEETLLGVLGKWKSGSDFPVTYAGGVHDLADIDKIEKYGDIDFTVGSALDLFGGSISLDEIIARIN